MKKNKLFSISVSNGRYEDFVQSIATKAAINESDYACVANVHMLAEAYKNSSFAQTVNNAAIVTPDGKPLIWALRLLHGIKQERVAGMDLLPVLLKTATEKKLSVFFYGGSESMLSKTQQYLAQNYPGLHIAGMHSPPFRKLTFEEEYIVIEKINNSATNLVFVILGCPKQEQWMASMKGRISTFMIGVGGALPVLIGMQRRAPEWMQSGGLEWLYRLSQEPRRLSKRYAVTNSLFLFLFLKAYLRKKVFHRITSGSV
jgi:N-acetylglucosaminyldiphosphoundecaprenol N-acetyl-beta-D-mannosaminyltransferase